MHRCKHICNSHKPTHRPKIAKELPPLPDKNEKLFFKYPLLKILKHNWTATTGQQRCLTMTAKNIGWTLTRKTEQLGITAPKKNGGRSANTNSCATNKVWWV